jgi:hypothetical protein
LTYLESYDWDADQQLWIGEQKEDMEYNNRGETTKHEAYEWDTTFNKWVGR